MFALLFLGIAGYWLSNQRGTNIDQAKIQKSEPTQTEPPSAIHQAAPRMIAAASSAASETPSIKKDRFVNRTVIAQKETVQLVNGVNQVKRLRLVRDPSFKYPLIRVEDEWVRNAQGDRLIRQVAMVADHVLIKPVDPQITSEALLAALQTEGASVRRKMPASGTWLIAFEKADINTVPNWVAKLSQMKDIVRYAEPDFILSANALPNDSSFGDLWGMHNTGQSGGFEDADIDAPEAWAISTGSQSVKVAVIDTGIDQTHPDLLANLWTNPNEIPNNGIDDDGNGYVDDLHGWDFVNEDANPQDDNGHGTHCAGTIGAVGNNDSGVVGVCWSVSLIGLKFLDASGEGALSDGVEAIAYASSIGVTLTSNSWSGGDYTQSMKDAIDAAGDTGILFIAAAGNDGVNLEYFSAYPASYNSTNLISVAATTRTEGLADFSNFGNISTDLGAPGLDIYSTVPSGYGYNSGTSMACPHVSGACAFLKAYQPTLTHLEIRDLLLKSVDLTPALTGKVKSGGRLNLYNALLAVDDVLMTPGTGFSPVGDLGGPFTPSSQVYTLTNYAHQSSTWTASVDQPWISLSSSSGTLSASESISLTVALNDKAIELAAGNQTATLTITNTTTGRTQERPITLYVNPLPIYVSSLDTDPGWTRTGEWAFGIPKGLGGDFYGQADPKSGATGTQVFGINLEGDYLAQPGQAQYLTAGPYDLSGHKETKLRFQRWLNSDYQSWVYATVEVSSDGNSWNTVWDNGTTPYNEAAWTKVEYDISAYADNQSTVYIRWGHRVANSGSYAYSGWNVDDIQILGLPSRELHLVLPDSVTEGTASTSASITVNPAPLSDLTVSLISSRPGTELSLPTSVLIPAGSSEATFPVAAIQDTQLDGSQTVRVTASAASYPDDSANIFVHDDEQGVITVNLPSGSFVEGSGEILDQASLSLNGTAAADIEIRLQSSDLTELQVPVSVLIPQGQNSVNFPLFVPDDIILDGVQNVTITASVTHWPTAQGSLTIADNEPVTLALILPEKRLESAGTREDEATIQVPGVLASPLSISLSTDDPSELTVPASVTILAGNTAATFSLHLQDDALVDGDQPIRVTASREGFISTTAIIIVADDEAPALPTLPSPAHEETSVHPDSSLSWQYDPHSGSIPDSYQVYFGIVPEPIELLGSSTTTSWDLVLPRLNASTTYYWRIIAQKGNTSRAGPIWTFTTATVGTLDRYVWDPTPTAVAKGVPFSVRVTAVDENDIPLTSFDQSTLFTAEAEQPETTTGTGTYQWYYPLATNYHDARTQSIYTPEEVGSAGKLTALALEVTTKPGQTMTNFTIRLKHTSKTNFLTEGLNWESDGWTTVYAADAMIQELGWTWFTFAEPFEYDGTSNLMVDFSFNNTNYTVDGATRTSITNDYRSLAFRTDSAYGDPLEWTNTIPPALAYNGLPNLRFHRASIVLSVTPGTSTPYSYGSWSGQMSLIDTAQSIRLKATDPNDSNITGYSELFNVVIVDDFALSPEPPFTGGRSNLLSGPPLEGEYEYEFQRATQADFSDAASSGYLTTPGHEFTQLTDGMPYHYRARALSEGAAGRWSEVVRSTQDATPPTITFSQPTGALTTQDTFNLEATAEDATSGFNSISINDATASSSGTFATLDIPPLSLVEGLNTVTVSATDNAVPPNVQTVTWQVTRITDLEGDPDHNGIPSLLEYAFNTDSAAVQQSMPTLSIAKNPDTNQPHLILTYRRRILTPSNLVYTVETSSDLSEWQSVESTAQILSANPTQDGITELVTVRINPSLEGQVRRFARVSVMSTILETE